MSGINIESILSSHWRWLDGEGGSRAALQGADLSGARLRAVNLRGADLHGADLGGADLHIADLRGADLRGADLTRADLSCADLSGANLRGANLRLAFLRGADLSGTVLHSANLSGADLPEANLADADLSCVALYGANLSGAQGLLEPVDWLQENLERDPQGRGYLAYKVFDIGYAPPARWVIEPGSIITEVVSPDRTNLFGCGINVATREFHAGRYYYTPVWRVLIRWEWLAGVVVPYNTDGRFRCSRVELLDIVK